MAKTASRRPRGRASPAFVAFLSHKGSDDELASSIQNIFNGAFKNLSIFRSEQIAKGRDWRKMIADTLEQADFLILLYTDPSDDWSWCLYETGYFEATNTRRGRDKRPIFCLHHPEIKPPDPLVNLQAIAATPTDVKKWIEQLSALTRQNIRKPAVVRAVARKIQEAVAAYRPRVTEYIVKPFIQIRPQWPTSNRSKKRVRPNWRQKPLPRSLRLEAALVDVDSGSAKDLGFSGPIVSEPLLPFLQTLDFDRSDRPPVWAQTFFESLDQCIREKLRFQEITYFRHESSRILRPIIDKVSKSEDGKRCICRVLFVDAFSIPPGEHASEVQRLADGIRLSVRTRLEVIDVYLGRMASLHAEIVRGNRREDAIARGYPVGRRLVQSLYVIEQEAASHGVVLESKPPVLFEGDQQKAYEIIRGRGAYLREKIKIVSEAEDRAGRGRFPRTEKLLAQLKEVTNAYVQIALPRLQEKLARTGPGGPAAA